MHWRATNRLQSARVKRPLRLWLTGLAGLALQLVMSPVAAEITAHPGPLPHDYRSLPAFHEIDHVPAKKREFFDYLAPLIRMENAAVLAQRRRLLSIRSDWEGGRGVSVADRAFIADLVRDYRLEETGRSYRVLLEVLLQRVDAIPRSLALAQAAKESGWGSSRFARQANNLFGQWCFERGCGLVPRSRPPGQTHEVRKYPTVRASVRSYVRNLNTHPSYEPLRQRRAALRSGGAPLCGVRLAEGLENYSVRRSDYVREVQTLIVQNDLEEAWTGGVPGRAVRVSAP